MQGQELGSIENVLSELGTKISETEITGSASLSAIVLETVPVLVPISKKCSRYGQIQHKCFCIGFIK